MRIAYFDCYAGADGNSILGALLDVGLSLHLLQADLSRLPFPVEIQAGKTQAGGIQATQACIRVGGEMPDWDLIAFWTALGSLGLPAVVTHNIQRIVRRLGEAEAQVRGISTESVALREMGGAECVATVVAVAAGLYHLEVEQVAVAPLPLGYGSALSQSDASPLPSPLVAALVADFPVYGVDVQAETVTSVGAAILTTLASAKGAMPAMTVERVGYGVGSRRSSFLPALRLWLGQSAGESLEVRTLALAETNIDDMNPEFYDHVMSQLFAAGALDVMLIPMQMKKNRPATLLRALCAPEKLDVVRDILLRETTTLGVRVQEVQRFALPRYSVQVDTPWGPVRVKVAKLSAGLSRAVPEYEDCRRLAETAGVPIWQVYQTAQTLADASLAEARSGRPAE